MSWSSLTEAFVCILPLVTNKTNDLQVSTLHQTLLDDTILYETQYWKETKCSNYTQLFCVFSSLTYCFCFPAKPGEDCPKCVHMKVGGVCKESNIGKSTGSRNLFFKIESESAFYDTMFVKVHETTDERNFTNRLSVVFLSPSPLG